MKLAVLWFFLFGCSCTSLAQGQWFPKNTFSGGTRLDGTAFSVGAYGFFGFGVDDQGGSRCNDLWKYDAQNDVWSQMANYPNDPRAFITAFVVDSIAYLCAGNPSIAPYVRNDLYAFDYALNIWSPRANLPGPKRYLASSFSLSGLGYVVGGGDSASAALNDVWEYNPSTDSWIQKNSFPDSLMFAVSFTIQNKAYITTGSDNAGNYFAALWEYDPLNDLWTQKSPFPGALRSDACSFTVFNFGYVGLGFTTNGSKLWDMWRYDPSLDIWTPIPAYPSAAREGARAFTLNNKGYVITGIPGTGIATNEVWEYDPSAMTVDDNNMSLELNIFPSPANELTTIQFFDGAQLHHVTITDCSGREIYSQKTLNSTLVIPVSHYPTGIYSCVVIGDKSTVIKSFAVTH